MQINRLEYTANVWSCCHKQTHRENTTLKRSIKGVLLVFHTELYNFHESLFLLFSEIMKVFHSERCFDNDLTPSDTWQWPTAVLVGHSQRLTSGGDSVPANEDSQSCSRINKAGH